MTRAPSLKGKAEGQSGWVLWLIVLGACMFLGAATHMEMAFLVISLVVDLLFAALGPRYKTGAPILIVSLLVLQNLLIGVGAHMTGNESSDLSYLTQIPFIATAVMFVSTIRERLNSPILDNRNRAFAALMVWCGLCFCIGGGSLPAKLVALRNLTLFYMAFQLTRASLQNTVSARGFYSQFGVCCVIVSVVGLALMLPGIDFWMSIGLQEVYIAKQAPLAVLTDWTGRFTTSIDGVHTVSRMMSTYYEPVNLAYLLASGLICIGLSWRGAARVLAGSVVLIGLVMTFGKGGWVVLGAFLVFGILCIFRRQSGLTKRNMAVSLAIVIGGVGAVLVAYFLFVGGAVRPHFWAIANTWGNVMSHPFGHGLGTGGNAATSFGSAAGEWLSSGQESALMSFAYQIGIPGVLMLFMVVKSISDYCPEKNVGAKGAALYAIPVILFAVSLLQDNTFSPQCIVPFMALLGSFSLDSGRQQTDCGIEMAGAAHRNSVAKSIKEQDIG